MKRISYFLVICVIFIAPIRLFADTLPSKYDLRNVNGKSYITSFKNQGDEGLCWDYASMAHFESRVLKEKNKSFDSTANIFSEKQTVYAAAAVITNGKRAYNKFECGLDTGHVGDGGGFSCAVEVMLDGLGAVLNTWDINNKKAIDNNNAPLDSTIVYNFDNSLYEVNSTIEYPHIRTSELSENDKKNLFNSIKENIIRYGGGVFDTDVGCDSRAIYGGKDVMVVGSAPGSSAFGGASPHSMQVIGWDDNYEYKVCKRASGFAYPPNDCPNDYFSGKGVWIIKNSWENIDENTLNSIALVAYDTYAGYDISFFKDISKKNWDNFYQLDSNYIDSNSRAFFFKDNEYVTDEVINKIKIKLTESNRFKIYYSENGNSNYILIGDITTDNPLNKTNFDEGRNYIGYFNIDLSSKSYHVNKNTKFKVVDGLGNYGYDFRVYTNNVDNSPKLEVKDVTFNKDKNNKSTYSFVLDTSTRNIKDKELLTYRIRDSNNNYLDNSYYSTNYNKVYANINSTKFNITSSEFKNGIYKIETYYKNTLLYSSNLNVIDSKTKNITKYTITYDSIDGETCDNPSKTVFIGEKWGELCVPTKANYMFDGWWTEKDGGIKIEVDTIAESDMTVYAHWIYNSETVEEIEQVEEIEEIEQVEEIKPKPKTGNISRLLIVILSIVFIMCLLLVKRKRL